MTRDELEAMRKRREEGSREEYRQWCIDCDIDGHPLLWTAWRASRVGVVNDRNKLLDEVERLQDLLEPMEYLKQQNNEVHEENDRLREERDAALAERNEALEALGRRSQP